MNKYSFVDCGVIPTAACRHCGLSLFVKAVINSFGTLLQTTPGRKDQDEDHFPASLGRHSILNYLLSQ